MWHSGLRGSGDSLLRAAVVCDLLHNLAVAFVSHDLMVSTKLKKRHAKSPAVPGLDILSPPCTGRIHSFLSGQPKAGLTFRRVQSTSSSLWPFSGASPMNLITAVGKTHPAQAYHAQAAHPKSPPPQSGPSLGACH